MNVIAAIKKHLAERKLPPAALNAIARDKVDLNSTPDKDPQATMQAVLQWLLKAQQKNLYQDGGYARDFSFIRGWASSYPETTGYAIPSLFAASDFLNDPAFAISAKRALDWLVSIQMADGAFQGGKIDSQPAVPVTFNTGQILIGLAAGLSRLGPDYFEATCKAADWLSRTLDEDGCWRNFPTPFAADGEKAYETHVAWGLMEAAKATGRKQYLQCALRNVDWALTKQQANGWFSSCCLENPAAPLTHTLGYVLRGVLEAYLHSKDEKYLQASLRTARPLAQLILEGEGYLPGRLDKQWQADVKWVCLTGSVQIASCLFILSELTNNPSFKQAAHQATAYVRKSIKVVDGEDYSGGVQGSYPVNGGYGYFQQLNWAAKFYLDAQMIELGGWKQDAS